jgi:hypothetical protein
MARWLWPAYARLPDWNGTGRRMRSQHLPTRPARLAREEPPVRAAQWAGVEGRHHLACRQDQPSTVNGTSRVATPDSPCGGSGPRSGFAQIGMYPLDLLRDEKAAGAKPATPTSYPR